MRIKNKDGTINSIPICIIFTVLAIGCHFFLFGFDFSKKSTGDDGKIAPVTTTTKLVTTINICNNCSINFKQEMVDISTNSEVDLRDLINLDKVSIADVSFTSSDPSIAYIKQSGSSYNIATSNVEGRVIINAKFTDKTSEMIVNVVHPSKASIKFKYDTYFTSKTTTIEPEIETYPLGLDTTGITFEVDKKSIIKMNSKKNAVTGSTLGSVTYSLKLNGMSAKTTVYSMTNVINVKVNANGVYKLAREVTPTGNSFDFVIQFEDNEKKNYDNNNISISFDRNDLGATAKFVKRHTAKDSYIYQIDNLTGTGKSIMRVELPDGSFTLFDINK